MSSQNFNFSSFNEPYSNLTESTSLNNSEFWDDDEFIIPIDFEFSISTHTFNTIYIVDWSVGGVLSSNASGNGILPIFIPIGQDIVSRFDSSASTSPLSYKTEGDAGSRILKIEWNNAGFFEDSTQNDFMNFQVWLYEGTNAIEYRYGPNEINNPDESFEGLLGPNVGLFSSIDINNDMLVDYAYVISGDPLNPELTVYQPGDEYDGESLSAAIPDGTVFRFEAAELAINEFDLDSWALYPNPTTETIHIKTDSPLMSLKVFSIDGKLVINTLENKTSLDVSHLPSGSYYIQLLSSVGVSTKQFVKL
ncbi:T9SS type A sorting domain-containing protein [Jejudonia soesokkakensis]|uniref:T9SS type A sorting domain-containing protein n=1 Tax=Jejudonia soesokkakensis TaxID=1323432 RepID=A0ABW2MX40_9FLAO